MRRLVFILIIMLSSFSLFGQQKKKDTNDMSLNITNYFFSYNTKFKKGDYAIGPTLLLNADERFLAQCGFLYDFKKYIFYEEKINSITHHIYYSPVKFSNFFIPLLFYYEFIKHNKLNIYLSFGGAWASVGGRLNEPYIINKNSSEKISSFNFIVGLGISYKIEKHWMFRIYPTMRNASPGISVDLSYLFNSKILEP